MSDTAAIEQGADLITIMEVAALLSVSRAAAARIAATPDFPGAFRLNARNVKYSKAAVLGWLKSKQDNKQW